MDIKSWWEKRPTRRAAIALCLGALLVLAVAEWLAPAHHKLVTVRLSNGTTIQETPKDWQSEAVTGESFPGDFTKVKHPVEPKLPPIPPMSPSK